MAANDTHAPSASGEVEIHSPGDATQLSEPSEASGSSQGSRPALPERQETVISRRRPDVMVPFDKGPNFKPLLEGETLGHFRLEQIIGGGGMGTVYRAVDTMLDRTVAVKILSREHSNDDLLKRFRNEAQSGARLDHENIARVHYVGEDKGLCYIVFEYIDGYNIRDLVVRRGPLPLAEAIRHTLAVAEALEHAYRRDVVHRDIKPSNVLITPEGHVKLVDMGLARLHQVESPDHDLTASGVTLGTFDYISPEQARDPRSADVRSDIYSLGCTLYFMLTGRPPFPDGTVLQKLLSHTSDERPDPRLYRPELPEEISAILNKMLAKHPDQRYQEPAELIGELLLTADFLGLDSVKGGTVWITPRTVQPGVVKRLIPVLLPVIALLVTVIALDRFWPSSAEEPLQITRPQLAPEENEQPVTPPPAIVQNTDRQPVTPAPSDVAPPVKDGTTEPVKPTPHVEQPAITAVAPRHDAKPSPLPNHSVSPALTEFWSGDDRVGPPDVRASASADGNLGTASDSVADAGAQVSAADLQYAPPKPLPVQPTYVVVGDADLSVPPEAKRVDSLAAALQFAKAAPHIKVIELRFNGPRVDVPFASNIPQMVIKAGEGFEPILVFRPADNLAAQPMIELIGGAFQWRRVHFVFDLPERNAVRRWSLFYLDQIKSLSMDHCTMTIRNAAADGSLRQDRVSFFEVNGPPPAVMPVMMPNAQPVAARPSITLTSCVARGEAVFISAMSATPFALNWKQGLFISSELLVEMSGTAVKPDWQDKVEIFLTNVTAYMEGGMVLLRSHPDMPHQLGLSIECKKCILLADPMVPLIENLDVNDVDETLINLSFDGEDNFFHDSAIVCRLSPPDGQSKVTEFPIERALAQDWFDQRFAGKVESITWQKIRPEYEPLHEHTKADYQLNQDDPTNPAVPIQAGFDPSKVPELPAIPEIKSPPGPLPTPSDATDG